MKAIAVARLLLASATLLAVVAVPLSATARTKVLEPVFLVKLSNTTAQQTEAVLRRSLNGRHWTVTRDAPNEIEAKLVVRDHSITTKFTWAATQVAVVYVGSENMDYEVDGDKTYIDRYYYRWLKYLQRDINNYSKRLGYSSSNVAAAQDDADDDADESPQKGSAAAGK